MRVTSKGQVTIPKDVREAFGIAAGAEVGFREEEGKIVLEMTDQNRDENAGTILIQQLKELGRRARREGFASGLTSEEIMVTTRGPIDDCEPD
jgi:AbrB family looped-hinge helix DNA binding protein